MARNCLSHSRSFICPTGPRARGSSGQGSRHLLRGALIAGATLTALLARPAPAQAQTQFAVDVEAAHTTVPDDQGGYGAGLRLGHVWRLAIIELTPEFGGSLHEFGGAPDASALNFMAGGRLGVNLILKPSVFAHAGVGHYAYEVPTRNVSNTSLAYDVGVALDFTAIPIIDVGAHASASGIAGSDDSPNFSWVALGGHVAFRFP